MKRIILILLMIAFLVGCEDNSYETIAVGNSLFDLSYEISNPLSFYSTVYRVGYAYVFVRFDSYGVIESRIVFLDNRKIVDSGGYNLIKNTSVEELYSYVGMPFENIRNCFGDVHIDIGSGFSEPSYITEDGYLISFHTDENIVVLVVKSDLFTGTVIEKTWD